MVLFGASIVSDVARLFSDDVIPVILESSPGPTGVYCFSV